MCRFYSKTDFTFLLQLIIFEPLELKQSYMPHLKVLMCGIIASGPQWCGCISILCYSCMNLALLFHKTVLINFPIGTTVIKIGSIIQENHMSFLLKGSTHLVWMLFGSYRFYEPLSKPRNSCARNILTRKGEWTIQNNC